MILEASPDDVQGLNLDDAFIRESIEHALEEEGKLRATGFETTAEGVRETEWRSEVEGAPQQSRAEVNPETGEVEPDNLREELDEFAAHEPDGGDDDE